MLKLLVVEDHALVREGLARLLSQLEDDVVVREVSSFESALECLEEEQDFDLVLLDLALPGIDGFSGLNILREGYPAIPVAVVSAFDDAPTVTRVMHLGASAFIPKAFSGDALVNAVREVLAGNLFYPDIARSPAKLDAETPLPPAQKNVPPAEFGITERQAQVLALLIRGLSNREIGQQLRLSEGTVKVHVTAVFKTLGVTSRTQATVAASRYGIDFESVFYQPGNH